jgi:hypothetical protein
VPTEFCIREGCERRRPTGNRSDKHYCSQVCHVVDQKITAAEKLCRSVGECVETTELWVAVTSLGDALTEYHEAVRLARRLQPQKPQGGMPSPAHHRPGGNASEPSAEA